MGWVARALSRRARRHVVQPTDKRPRDSRGRRTSSRAASRNGTGAVGQHAHALYVLFHVLSSGGDAGSGARRPNDRSARALARDAPSGIDVHAGESRTDTIGLARVGGASELLHARDRARCTSGERWFSHGSHRAVARSTAVGRGPLATP